jgi:regulator of sigma E protease
MDILIKAAQFFLSISILIILHEFGHYITAKIFKCRVEKFYLFFDPWFSLFKIKKGETEYGIGWVPLGGYVKIAGMIDESMDKETLKRPAEPWEFRSKPAWQRLIILLAGITMNMLLAFFIYWMILFFVGEQYLPNSNVVYGISTDSLGQQIGFRNGDKLVSIDGKPIKNFDKVVPDILINQNKTVVVNRGGLLVAINISLDDIKQILENKDLDMLIPRFPFVVDAFADTSAAKKANFQKNDRVIAVNGTPTMFVDEIRDDLDRNKNKPLSFTVLRGTDSVKLSLVVPASGLIGVHLKSISDFIKIDTIRYSLLSAFPAGISKTFTAFVNYVKQFKLIFSSKVQGYKHLGGFLSIGNVFTPHWDWLAFWSFTAFISIALAFINLVPIPALDGGHVLFTLYEMVTGRKPGDKFLEYAQIAGMVIILGLILLSNGNDIYRLLTGKF